MSNFLDEIVAIDVHTHATVSTRNPPDEVAIAMDAAMDAYFKQPMPRPTIAQTAAYHRERKMLAVIFTVDTERETGQARITNEEVAEEAAQHRDALIPYASVDPLRGKMGAREVRCRRRCSPACGRQRWRDAFGSAFTQVINLNLVGAFNMTRLAATDMMATPEVQQSLAESIPFPKRIGHADEFAELVVHTVQNRYLNGEVIRLDGAVRLAPR